MIRIGILVGDSSGSGNTGIGSNSDMSSVSSGMSNWLVIV
jgi:hypothetical protein